MCLLSNVAKGNTEQNLKTEHFTMIISRGKWISELYILQKVYTALHRPNNSLEFTDALYFKVGDRKQRRKKSIIHTVDSLSQISIDLSFNLPPV